MSKRCAIVFCEDSNTLKKILGFKKHRIEGKLVRCNKADDNRKGTKIIKTHKIFIGNVHYSVSQDQLLAHFSKYGIIQSLKLVKNTLKIKDSEVPSNHCLIDYENQDHAKAVLDRREDHIINSQKLSCSPYKSEKQKQKQTNMLSHSLGININVSQTELMYEEKVDRKKRRKRKKVKKLLPEESEEACDCKNKSALTNQQIDFNNYLSPLEKVDRLEDQNYTKFPYDKEDNLTSFDEVEQEENCDYGRFSYKVQHGVDELNYAYNSQNQHSTKSYGYGYSYGPQHHRTDQSFQYSSENMYSNNAHKHQSRFDHNIRKQSPHRLQSQSYYQQDSLFDQSIPRDNYLGYLEINRDYGRDSGLTQEELEEDRLLKMAFLK